MFAVAKRDLEAVRTLLRNGCNPNSPINFNNEASLHFYCGNECTECHDTPLSLSLDWPEGIRLLIDAGACPITALVREFVWRPRTVESLDILIESGLPLSIRFSRPDGGGIYSPYQLIFYNNLDLEFQLRCARKLLVQRYELQQLTLLHLSTDLRRQLLSSNNDIPDDLAARNMSHALIEKGVLNKSDPSVVNTTSQSCYLVEFLHPEVAECLYQSGLKPPPYVSIENPSEPASQCTFLNRSCTWLMILISNWKMVRWLSAKGLPTSEMNLPLKFGLAYFTRLAIFRPMTMTYPISELPLIGKGADQWLEEFSSSGTLDSFCEYSRCLPNDRDSCICLCSDSGCTSTTQLLRNRISLPKTGHSIPTHISFPTKIKLLNGWLKLSDSSENENHRAWREFFRLEVFERLGFAHTCHHWHFPSLSHPEWLYHEPHRPLSDEERSEMQDEDAHLKPKLVEWMSRYDEAFAQAELNGTSLKSFIHEILDILNQELPENETYEWFCEEVGWKYNPLDYIHNRGEMKNIDPWFPDCWPWNIDSDESDQEESESEESDQDYSELEESDQ
jgi:hypothetical protein